MNEDVEGAGTGRYELRIRGLRGRAEIEAVRWELFVFPEVRDVVGAGRPETVAVLYEGVPPDPAAWCAALQAAGYEAEPARMPGLPLRSLEPRPRST